jgi:pimeloyl-ACP methyl ester carboxylesterase
VDKTIFMIHGMCAGGWIWQNYKEFFEGKGYQCIAPTLRFHDMDHNDTPDPRLGTTSLLDFTADLENEIRSLGEKPIVMGHSMGGLLAQILGSRGLARALILLTPAPPAGIWILKPSVVRASLSGLKQWGFWRKPLRQTFDELVYAALHLMTPAEQKEIFNRFVYESGRASCEIGFWFLDSKRASMVDEAKITCPVLVIAGAQDRTIPTSVARQIARKYKSVSTYKELPDHAHWVVGEPGWTEIAGYISDWLDRVKAEQGG